MRKIILAMLSLIMMVGLAMSVDRHQEVSNGDPSAQADIHASHIVSNFASEINPGRYYTNPNTKMDYYLIGSGVNRPVAADKTEIIQLAPTEITPTNDDKIETNQTATNQTTQPVINTYNTYNIFITPDNNTKTNSSAVKETTPKTKSSDGGSSTGSYILENYPIGVPTTQITDGPNAAEINNEHEEMMAEAREAI